MVGPVNAQLPFAGAGQALSTLGMQVLIFGWLAVATTFRALYHYEWIPSTAAFQLYSLVAMTVYQSLASNVVAYPNQMGSSLLAATQFVFGKARETTPRRAARAIQPCARAPRPRSAHPRAPLRTHGKQCVSRTYKPRCPGVFSGHIVLNLLVCTFGLRCCQR